MKYFLPILILVVFNACQDSDPVQESDVVLTEEISSEALNESLGDFQWNIFQRVIASEESGENVNISPLSVAGALYLAYEGADGGTRDAMATALKVKDQSGNYHLGQAYEDLIQLLEDGEHLTNVNGIFWDKNRMLPRDSFLLYAEKYFDAGQFELDFSDPSALSAINDWVEEATKSRIDKIIEKINAEEVMFLINALYFTADWKSPFQAESTWSRPFMTASGASVEAPFMFQDVNTIPYYVGSDFSAVEMPFADDKFSMVLLLPAEDKQVNDLIGDLTHERMNNLLENGLNASRVHLYVPKFEVESKLLLNEILKKMGMEVAFDPQAADFGNLGVAPEGNLYISRVNHKTYLKIDEKGAEGAAVTSVGFGVESAPPVINFSRPFAFLLRHVETGALVFAGKIENPL